MQDVGAQHLVLTGQGIDDHFRTGCAVGEVVERTASSLVAIIEDLRRAVEAGAGERYLAEIGLLDDFLEAQEQVTHAHLAVAEFDVFRGDLVFAHQKINQALLECFGSVLCGLAVKVGTAGGGSRRGVWHLVGVGGGDLDTRDIHLQHFSDDLRDLGVEALAHFGAAVVQVNRTIGVDMDQRAGLVEEGGGKADTEFHRGQRQAFLQHGALGVERADFFAALGVVTAGFQLGGHLVDNVVLDGLVVVGDVALGLAVVVELAYFQRVFAQTARDRIHDLFNGDHALRAAETAVGGVRSGVGLAAVAIDGGVAEEVGVVGMEHCTVDDLAGQVRRITAVAGQFNFDTVQQAVVVKADVVLDVERVTFAGDLHVFDARQAHLGRPAGEVGDHRTQARRACGLGFLAAETATHAAHVDDDLVHRHAEHFSHQLLHFGGVLRRGVDDHAAVFSRHNRGNLGFQVEVFLAADMQAALQAARRSGQLGAGIDDLVLVAVEDEMLLAQRIDHVEHRFKVFVLDDRGHGRLACGFQAIGTYGQYHLTNVFNLAVRQQRVTGHDRADVQLARYVILGDGNRHARELVAGAGIDADDARVSAVAHTGIDVQLIGELQAVVDVDGFAGDVFVRTFMFDALADASGDVGAEQFGQFGLAFNYMMIRHTRSPGFRLRELAARGRIYAADSVQ